MPNSFFRNTIIVLKYDFNKYFLIKSFTYCKSTFYKITLIIMSLKKIKRLLKGYWTWWKL